LLIQSVDEGSARLVNAVQEVAMCLGQSVPLVRPIGLQVKFKFATLTDQFQIVDSCVVAGLTQDCIVNARPRVNLLKRHGWLNGGGGGVSGSDGRCEGGRDFLRLLLV
jgi:hypothetical protein